MPAPTGLNGPIWGRVRRDYVFAGGQHVPEGTLVYVPDGFDPDEDEDALVCGYALLGDTLDQWRFFLPCELAPTLDYAAGEVALCLARLS